MEVWFHVFLTLAKDGGKLSASHYRSSSLVVDPGLKSLCLCHCCSSVARSSSPQKSCYSDWDTSCGLEALQQRIRGVTICFVVRSDLSAKLFRLIGRAYKVSLHTTTVTCACKPRPSKPCPSKLFIGKSQAGHSEPVPEPQSDN